MIPGGGFFPSDLSAAVQGHLGQTANGGLISRGAGFFRTIGLVQHRPTVQLVSTALVDGSGTPRNNGCQPADSTVVPDALAPGAEARVRAWSSVRWISRIAAREGFPISGESAGPHVAPYYPGVVPFAELSEEEERRVLEVLSQLMASLADRAAEGRGAREDGASTSDAGRRAGEAAEAGAPRQAPVPDPGFAAPAAGLLMLRRAVDAPSWMAGV